MTKTSILVTSVLCAASIGVLPACEDKKPPAPQTPTGTTPKPDDHKHAGDHHGGPVIELGKATFGGFEVSATRDDGQVVAGKDVPIDATVKPAEGSAAKVAAVRFWIGTEDAKGSVKAKADVEDPKEPDRWHTHAEVPNPLPAGSKLWIEIEDDKGGKGVGSFDLKS